MTVHHAPSLRLTGCLAALAIALAGCSGDPTSAQPSPSSGPPTSASLATPTGALTWDGTSGDKSPTWASDLDPASRYGLHQRKGLQTVVRPELHVLSSSEAAAITAVEILNRDECLSDAPTHPMCRFRVTFGAVPADVKVGTVLNAGVTASTPNGLLVKVTEMAGATVTGVQATLQDALAQGEFWVEQELDATTLRAAPTLATGVTLKAGSPDGPALPPGEPARGHRREAISTFDAIGIPGELSIDAEPVDGVHLSGSIDFGAGCGLDGGVGGSDIAWVEASCHAWEQATIALTSTGSGPRHTERFFIADVPLAAIPIPIGPLVVVVVIDILVTADLDGSVYVNLHYGGTERAELTGSLRFSLGHGLDHDGSVKVSAWPDANGVAASVEAKAVAVAELRLSAYGVLGFSVGADASLIFSGGPTQTPRWQLRGNAGVFASIFLGIVGFELRAMIAYHLKAPFLIASGGNAPPTITVTAPVDGSTISAGGLGVPLTASAVDVEDGNLPVTWEDTTDHKTVKGSGTVSLPLSSVGVHTLKVTATDKDGAQASKIVTVTVKPPSLSISLAARDSALAPLIGTPSLPAGSVVYLDATVTTGALTPPGCSAITWSASGATVKSDGSCRATVTLTTVGTAKITAIVKDAYQSTATASAAVTVTAPPPTVSPQFAGIDARSHGLAVTPGGYLNAQDPVTLTLTYLNHPAAGVPVSYEWTSTLNGSPVTLAGGPDGDVSTRTFTPPTPWGFSTTFTVVAKNATTGAVLTTRTFLLKWYSAPK